MSFSSSAPVTASAPAAALKGMTRHRLERAGATFDEMGIGRGGKIIQKIYPDPHGLAVWEHAPWATLACYLVNAEVFEEITGEKIPRPVSSEKYLGPWFGLQDKAEGDVAGTSKFTGLKSAVFSASTPQTNDAPEPEPVATKSTHPKTNAV